MTKIIVSYVLDIKGREDITNASISKDNEAINNFVKEKIDSGNAKPTSLVIEESFLDENLYSNFFDSMNSIMQKLKALNFMTDKAMSKLLSKQQEQQENSGE